MEKMPLRSLLYQHSQQPQPTWGTPGEGGQAPTQPQTAQDNRTQLGPFLPLQVRNVISLELHLGIVLSSLSHVPLSCYSGWHQPTAHKPIRVLLSI